MVCNLLFNEGIEVRAALSISDNPESNVSIAINLVSNSSTSVIFRELVTILDCFCPNTMLIFDNLSDNSEILFICNEFITILSCLLFILLTICDNWLVKSAICFIFISPSPIVSCLLPKATNNAPDETILSLSLVGIFSIVNLSCLFINISDTVVDKSL